MVLTFAGSTAPDDPVCKPQSKDSVFKTNEEAVEYIKKVIEERMKNGYELVGDEKENSRKKLALADASEPAISPKYSHETSRHFLNNLTTVDTENDEELLKKRTLNIVEPKDTDSLLQPSRKQTRRRTSSKKKQSDKNEESGAAPEVFIRLELSDKKTQTKIDSSKHSRGKKPEPPEIKTVDRDDFHAVQHREQLIEIEKANTKTPKSRKTAKQGQTGGQRSEEEATPGHAKIQGVDLSVAIEPVFDEDHVVSDQPFFSPADIRSLYAEKPRAVPKEQYRHGCYLERLVTRSSLRHHAHLTGSFFTEYFSLQAKGAAVYFEYGLLENSSEVKKQLHVCSEESDAQLLLAIMLQRAERINFKRRDECLVDSLSDGLIASMRATDSGHFIEHPLRFGEQYERSLCISSGNGEQDSDSKYVLREAPPEEGGGPELAEPGLAPPAEEAEERDLGDETQEEIHQAYDKHSHSNPLFDDDAGADEKASPGLGEEELAKRRELFARWQESPLSRPRMKYSQITSVHPLGQPTDGPFELNLASNYSDKISVGGWLASVKLDGLRCLWTGRALFTRLGKQLHPPGFFLASFPCSPLDGELYSSKGYAHLMEALRSESPDAWVELTYWVFDCPGINLQFRQRLESLKAVLTRDLVFIRLVPFEQVRDKADVERRLLEAEESLFEGVVLRNPASLYERKRSWGWLKVKRHLDLEVKVLASTFITRRKHQRLARDRRRPALLVETVDSRQTQFRLVSGLSEEQIRDPATVGRLLTVKCCGLQRDGRPRQPVFHRVHQDL